MADEPEKSGQEPNLELPSLLGFGRKKKRKGDASQHEPVTADLAAPEAATQTSTETSTERLAEPAEDSDPLAADPVPEPRAGLTAAAERPKRLPPGPPPGRLRATGVRVPPPPPPPAPPAPVAPPAEVVEEPAAFEEPAPVAEREAPAEQTVVLPSVPVTAPAASEPPVQLVAPTYGEHPIPVGEPDGQAVLEPEGQVDVAEVPVAAPTKATSSTRRLPVIDSRIAVFVTGAVIGLVGVLLEYLASRGCESVRGVGSCGGIGLFALLVILAIQVLLGAAVLRACRVFDPVSTSFLGVGLVAVFVLLFLLGALESASMLAVIPVISGLSFLLSWWVTTAIVEDPLGR